MIHRKHQRASAFTPTVARWLTRARVGVQLATMVVALVRAVVALLSRIGFPGGVR